MRNGWPSLTALYVALARGVATQEDELSRVCQDAVTATLLPRPLRSLLTAARDPTAARVLRALSFGMYDHIALRTALIDRALTQALTDGIEQVVLLGAGFDARAHRLPALSTATVFEVDHPDTQALKQAGAARLPRLSRQLHYVASDFERRSLKTTLGDAGYDPSRRSVWIWEGVTMYLPRAAVVDALDTVTVLCPAGSLLIATYVGPELLASGGALGRLAHRAMRMLAEPIQFTTTAEEFAALLDAARFQVLSDVAPKDAAAHYGIVSTRPTTLTPKERIVVAKKRGESP